MKPVKEEKKSKKVEKNKSKKSKEIVKLVDILRSQADLKNEYDCASILEELNQASLEGEYTRAIKLKINQSMYIKTLGLIVTPVPEKIGLYEISWKNEE
jgi:hypothetical protein